MRPTVAAVLAMLLALQAPAPAAVLPFVELPPLTLWVWERSEDLRELPEGIAVGLLAQTVTLAGTATRLAPRRQPVRLADHTPIIAVTRIEIDSRSGWTPTDSSLEEAVQAISATAALPAVGFQKEGTLAFQNLSPLTYPVA